MKIFLKILSITAMMLSGTSYIHAQDVELTIKFDEEECMYGVYARPDFSNADFFVAGGSQITVVLPESITNTVLNITNEAGGPWSDNSQIYAPAAAPGLDFHAISSNGSELDFTAGEEILLFTFTLPETCCAPGVRLFNNGSDPDSSAPGMEGGDFNNYFADAFFFIDYYETNYNNAITIDPPTGSASQEFCAIDSPTVADLVTNETGVTWYDAATNGNIIAPSASLTDGTVYYGALQPGTCASGVRLAVTVTVNDAVAPTGETTQSFCVIDSPTVADLDADGGTVTWYDAPSGGNPVTSGTTLVDGNTYYGSLSSGSCESSVRLAVTVDVNDAPTPTGDASQDFCVINNPTVDDLEADQTNVTWYDAATGGSIVSGGTGLAGETIYYGSLTNGSCESSVRFAVTVNINDAATPTGDASQDFCAIDNPTVSDIVTVEPAVTWYNAATGGSIVSGNTSLLDGAAYYGSLTSGSCASSVRLAVTVNVGDAAAPTGDTNQEFCAVDNPTVSDIVTVENSVVWYDAPTGGNIVDVSESLINNEVYYGSQVIGSCSSSVRLAVTVTINDAATPTGAASQSFCAISNPTVNNLTAGGGTVTWYNAATGGSILAGTTPLAEGETYYGSLTSGECTSSVRLAVTVTIDDAATPTGDTSQDFCEIDNPTVNDLIVNESPVTWYNAATGGSSVSGSTALNDGETYYASITDGDSGCASSVRLAVTVNINDTSPPTGDAVQDFCAIDSPTVSDIITNENSVTWYDAAAGGSIVSGSTALIDGTTYYGSLTGGSCESATRLAVTVNINDTVAPTTTDDTQEFCSYANPTLSDIEVNENNITWYAGASGGSALPLGTTLVNNTTYYASATDVTTGCESTSRLPVTVTLTDVCDVTLNVKVMLQGPLLGTVDNLMRDNLRALGLIPLEQPYSDSVNARYTQVDNAGSEVTTNAVLNANAGTADAVVDWIFIELRDALDETTVIKTLSALVQRDGDVIAANGGSLVISDLPQTFYISVKHRNHFGALAANPVTVSAGAATLDFTTLTGSDLYSLPGYDPDVSMITVNGTMALYAGNANYDVRIKYDGVGNDRQTMGSQVLNDPANSGNVLNFANTTGYYSGDVNMDGRVLYDGSNNDRAILKT